MDYHTIEEVVEPEPEAEPEPEPEQEQEQEQEPEPEPEQPNPIIITYSSPLMSGLLQNFMNMPIPTDMPMPTAMPMPMPMPMPSSLEERVMNQSFHQKDKFKKVCSKDFINSLSVQKVSKELVDKKITCSLCMEELILDEDIIELPCKDKHYFHIKKGECPGIYPWLKENDTCPLCRYEFPSVDKQIEQEDQEEIPPQHSIRPIDIRSIINQALEDQEERMLQEAILESMK